MKKQLTIFAAAAMLVSFAGAAFAATATVNMAGKIIYSVEYAVTGEGTGTDKWTNDADKKFNDGDHYINFSVTTSGNPNVGTVTFDLSKNNSVPGAFDPDLTISGTIKDATLKLGSVGGDWDEMTNNWGGAGAEIIKPFGKMSFDAVTTGPVANAVRVSGPLGKASLYGAAVMNPENIGLVYAGGTAPLGTATLTAKAGKEIGDTENKAFFAKVELPVNAALKLTAKTAYAETGYDKFTKVNNDIGIDSLGKVATQTDRDNALNLFARADYTVVADKVVAYGEADYKADTTYTVTAGTSYKPMFVDDAKVSVTSANVSTFQVKASKGAISAGAGYTTGNALAVNNGFGGMVKVSKSFDWLSTYAAVSKGWNRGDNCLAVEAARPFAVVVGASASVSF